jgi:uncharacterized protein
MFACRGCNHDQVRELIVEYRKWPTRMHYRTTMTALGMDSAGIWAGSRRGAVVVRSDGTTTTFAADAVSLFPSNRRWAARWYAKPADSGRAARFRCYLDITTPPVRTDSGIHLVDLDLDLALTWDDQIVPLDEEEFGRNRLALHYPELLAQQALDTFAEMRIAVAEPAFPFDGTADSYLTAWFNDPTGTPL